MVKVKLDTDFIDIYDHWFDLDGEVTLHRRMNQGPNRIEMYKILNAIGLKTPKFGMVADLYKDLAGQFRGGKDAMKKADYDKLVEMVVYTDVESHTGEGKIKMSLEEAREKYPGHFASQFIPTSKTYASRTERLLVVGRHHLWIEYISKDDWRSNCGDVQMTALDVPGVRTAGTQINELQIPLYAIDFVAVGNERLAIDFNVSPGIKGTPATDMMSAKEMAYAIKDRMTDLYEIKRF